MDNCEGSGWRTVACVAIGLGFLACGSGRQAQGAASADLNWPDIESRIQYAYYTEDVRSLRSVLDLLASNPESHDAWRSYYAALADYRLTLLLRADRNQAKQAAEHCVSSLDQTLQGSRDLPDALALQAACLNRLAELGSWRGPLAASRSGSEGERAKQLAPRNPRVLLLAAIADYERPKVSVAQRQRSYDDFRKAAAAFEAERQENEPTPGWGAAEAYVYLARCDLDRGAPLEARDALEHALLLAPEYAQARSLMSQLTS